jgi:LysM repeat protein
MLRHLVLSIFFALFAGSASAAIDSLSVENLNGKKNIVHKVEAKETYYSIARKYNVTPQSVIQFNSNKSLQIGTILRVPTERPFEESTVINVSNKQESNTSAQTAVIDYKVAPREYLIAIAKKFNTTVEYLKTLNNLSSNSLSIGQIIKVPLSVSSELPASPPVISLDIPKLDQRSINTPVDSSKSASERLKLPVARYGLREVNERGVAIWIEDENLDGTKMLALHQTAPIGTVIKITNPMTGKSTFAKIVGKFTQNESSKDALIVVTKATADLIGARDKRFQAILIYGVPNE